MLEKFKSDIILAMKNKDKTLLNTLRSVKGALQLEVINNKKEETEELLLDVISKQIKLRNDSIEEFKKASREDLVASYQEEVDILKKYLPEALSDEKVDEIINEIFELIKPTSIKDLGQIMKEITPKVKNRYDMKKLNEKIREKLNN